jgi:hypothetical protein
MKVVSITRGQSSSITRKYKIMELKLGTLFIHSKNRSKYRQLFRVASLSHLTAAYQKFKVSSSYRSRDILFTDSQKNRQTDQ